MNFPVLSRRVIFAGGLSALTASIIVGCGGGNSSTTTVTDPTAFPLPTVLPTAVFTPSPTPTTFVRPTAAPSTVTNARLTFTPLTTNGINTVSTIAITTPLDAAGAQPFVTSDTTGVHLGYSDYMTTTENDFHVLVIGMTDGVSRNLNARFTSILTNATNSGTPNNPNGFRNAASNPDSRAFAVTDTSGNDSNSSQVAVTYTERSVSAITWTGVSGTLIIRNSNPAASNYSLIYDNVQMKRTDAQGKTDSFIIDGTVNIIKRDVYTEPDSVFLSHQTGFSASSSSTASRRASSSR